MSQPVPEVPGHPQDTCTLPSLRFWGSALSLLPTESAEEVFVFGVGVTPGPAPAF